MALVDCPAFLFPGPLRAQCGGTSFAANAMADANDAVAGFCAIPKAGNITKIGFRTGTSSSPVGTLAVGLYAPDANGDPDVATGAYKGMVVGTQANPAANTSYTLTLGTQATAVVKGDTVLPTITWSAYTSGSVNIQTHDYNGGNTTYKDVWATAWTRAAGQGVFWLEYDDGSYAYIGNLFPGVTITTANYKTSASPDEVALRFNPTAPFRAAGIWFKGRPTTVAATYNAVLYNAASSALETTTCNPATNVLAASGLQYHLFDTPVALTAGLVYRVAVLPTADVDVAVMNWTAPTNAVLDQTPGGKEFFLSTRADAGAWTDSDTQKPVMGLIVDQIDDATGGAGGLLVHSGMTGGLNA